MPKLYRLVEAASVFMAVLVGILIGLALAMAVIARLWGHA